MLQAVYDYYARSSSLNIWLKGNQSRKTFLTGINYRDVDHEKGLK